VGAAYVSSPCQIIIQSFRSAYASLTTDLGQARWYQQQARERVPAGWFHDRSP